MRHPRRSRNISLAVAVLGTCALLTALVLARLSQHGTPQLLLGVLGFKALVVGAVLALVYHVRVVRRYDRLCRGEGVLIDWRIDAERWRVFREATAAIDQTNGARRNELRLPEEIPATGIDVRITRDALQLGSEYEPIEANATARLVNSVLEIEHRVPVNRYRTRVVALRLPTPAEAEADVKRLADALSQRTAASVNLVRTIAIGLLIVAVGVLIGIIVWATRTATS